MIPLPRRPALLVLAAMSAAPLAGSAVARADETGRVMRIAERCDVYGPGFVDIGNGACGQIVTGSQAIAGQVIAGQVIGGDRIRADEGRGWPAAGTSNAALHSAGPAGEGLGMVRGAAGAQHLRIGASPYER